MKVLIKGGLGNQLFQVCYLHFLHKSSGTNIGTIKDPNSRVDRPFLLERILHVCTHIEGGVIQNPFLVNIKNRLAKIRFIRGLVYRSQVSKSVNESHEYDFSFEIPNMKRNSIFIGYFQHWRYVDSCWEIVGPEIFAALDQQVIRAHSVNEYLVIHVRRGDFTLQNEQLGILKNHYYEDALQVALAALNLPGISIFVITDDPEEAKQMLSANNEIKIIGPAELDEWGCLSLMSGAKAVITANSTLSWWGGYLAYKNGGIMVIPKPWFDLWGERVGSAFAHPGVLQVDSRFEQ